MFFHFFSTFSFSASAALRSSLMAGIRIDMSTLKQFNAALGKDKMTVLAVAIDHLRDWMQESTVNQTIDDQIETLGLADLADRHGITIKALRERISSKLGPSAVIRLGKCLVIRKTRYLEFLRACEEDAR
ncbi:MAG: hypothetical protein JNJ70_24350 [Verrucomicrobiales bacterium]|nr:hypothetical protein [Verrucomicrobiales bacterium]